MKTIIDANNVSIHLWKDDDPAILAEDGLYFNEVLVNNNLTLSNASIVENIVAPDDWYGSKYCYTDNQWVLNPNDPLVVNP